MIHGPMRALARLAAASAIAVMVVAGDPAPRLSAEPDQVQEPRDCFSQCGTRRVNHRCNDPDPCGVGGGVRVDTDYLRRTTLQPGFQSMVRELTALGVPNLSGVARSSPATLGQLDQLLDVTYVEAATHATGVRDDLRRFVAENAKVRGFVEGLRRDTDALAPDPLRARLQEAETRHRELESKVETEEALFRTLRATTGKMKQRYIDARSAASIWLGPFLPADERKALQNAMGGSFLSDPWSPTYQSTPPPARAADAGEPPAQAAPVEPLPVVPRAQPPGGSPEQKAAALQAVVAELTQLVPQARRASDEFVRLQDEWTAASAANYARRALVAELRSLLQKQEDDVRVLETRVADAYANQRIEAEQVLQWAARAYIWDAVKKTRIVSAVSRVIKANDLADKIQATDDGMKKLWYAMRDGPALVSIPSRLKQADQVRKVSVQIIDLASNMDSLLSRAVWAIDQGSPQEAQALIDEIFGDVGERGATLMRTASGTLPGPLGSLMTRMTGRSMRE